MSLSNNMNEQNLTALHTTLPSLGIEDITYEDFKARMALPENRRILFDTIEPLTENLGTYEEFEQRLAAAPTPLKRENVNIEYEDHENQKSSNALTEPIEFGKKDIATDTDAQLKMLYPEQYAQYEKGNNRFVKFINSLQVGISDVQDISGGIADWMGFDESAKTIREAAKKRREMFQEPELLEEFEWSDVADPDFWVTKVPRIIPTMAAIIPAAVGGAYVGGTATAAGAAKIGLGALGTKIAVGVGTGISGAVASRPIESLMEAGGMFNQMKDEGYSDEEAGKAAEEVFNNNMKLVVADGVQIGMAFAKLPPSLRKGFKKYVATTGKVALASGSEGYEEVLQGYISDLAVSNVKGELPPEIRKYIFLGSPEIKEQFALGSIAGLGMEVAGASFKGKLSKDEVDNVVREQLKVTPEEEAKWMNEQEEGKTSWSDEQIQDIADVESKKDTERLGVAFGDKTQSEVIKAEEKQTEEDATSLKQFFEKQNKEDKITKDDLTKRDVVKEGDITEKVEAGVKEEKEEITEEVEEISEEEVDIDPEDGVKEVSDFFQALDPKTKISWSEKVRTLQEEIDDETSDVTATSALASIIAAGYDPSQVKPSEARVKGSNVQVAKDGVIIDQIKLYKGADIGTVIEERSESWYKRQLQTDTNFDSKIQTERDAFEKSTGVKTTESNLEWFSTLAKQNAIGGTISGKLSRTLKNLLNKFRDYATALIKNSEQFKAYVKEGKVSPELKTYLDQSVLAKTPTVDIAGNQTFEIVLTDRARLTKKVPELKPIQKYLTDKEISELSNVTKPTLQKIVDQYNKLKKQGVEKDMPAAALAGISKKGWYKNSAQAIVDAFGAKDGFRFASLLAATSPQTSVESNLKNTLNIWKNWDAAGRPTSKSAILDIMGESVEGEKGKDSILEAWVNNSLRSLQAKDVNDIRLSGAKVDSFLRNLTGDPTEVTNDTWMANFGNVKQTEYFGERKTKALEDEMGQIGVKGAGYLAFNAIVRKTADKLTKLNPNNPWTPSEVQETVWSWSKAALERRRVGGRSIEQLVEEGEITDAMIAETPDFAKLLKLPEFNNILKGTKYEKRIEKLKEKGQIARDARLDERESRNLSRAARRLDKIFRQRSIKDLSIQATKNISYERVNNFDRGGIYRRGAGLYRNNNLGKVRTYSLDKNFKEKLENIGCSHLPFYELIGDGREKTFYDALNNAKKEMGDFGASVDIYATPEEYSGLKLFLSNDKNSGFAIKEDGDIVAVFNSNKNRKTKKSHLLTAQIALAVQAGGRKLDAYNIYLTDMYTKLGFRPVSRVKWDDKFAPEGWNKERFKGHNNGKPDVYTYIFDPTFNRKKPPIKNIKPFNNYDQAIQYQQDKLNELIQNPNKKTFELELISKEELKQIRIQEKKDLQAKREQISRVDATEAAEAVPEFNRKRRNYIEQDGFERSLISRRIKKITTKAEREVIPYLMEGTPVPKELNRPDLEALYNDPAVRKRLDDTVKEMRTLFDRYWKRQVDFNKDLAPYQKSNYITHIWNIPKNKKVEVTNWFTNKNKFQEQRYIETLAEGIRDYGLTPKFNDVLDIFNTYANLTTNVLANQQYIKDIKALEKNGIHLIMNPDIAPADWKVIDHPALRLGFGYYKVHPDIHGSLNVVLGSRIASDNEIINAIQNINGFMKKSQLSISLFHHIALTESALVFGGIKNTIKMWLNIPVESMWKNKKGAWLDAGMSRDFIKHGGQLGASQDIPVQNINSMLKNLRARTNDKGLIGKFTKLLETANEKWDAVLWDWLHDGYKVLAYENLVSKINPSKVENITAVKREYAQLVNDTFGGQNFDVLGTITKGKKKIPDIVPFVGGKNYIPTIYASPKTMQVMSWFLLSPDWTISTIRQALSLTGIGSVTKEARAFRAKAGGKFWLKAGIYSMFFVNLLNYMNRKRDMEENPQYYPEFKDVSPTFWDYTMFGNTAGNETYLFQGRYENGKEEYLRWGKQFRELVEWFRDDYGWNFPKAAIRRLGSKSSPPFQLAYQVFDGTTPSGFTNPDLKDKDGIEYNIGLAKTLARSITPFSFQGMLREDKEWRYYNLMFPSKAGTSKTQLAKLMYRKLKNGVLTADPVHVENVVKEISIASVRNNIVPQDVYRLANNMLHSDMREETEKGLKTSEDYMKKAKEMPDGSDEQKRLLKKGILMKSNDALLQASFKAIEQIQAEIRKDVIVNPQVYEQ